MPPDPLGGCRPMTAADQLSRAQTFPPPLEKILYETLISATHANHNRPWQSCSWGIHWNTNIYKGYHMYWAMGYKLYWRPSGGVAKYQCSFRKRTDPLSLSSFSTLCTKTSVKYLPKPLCRIVKTTKNLHLEFYLLYSIAPPIYSMPHIYVPFTLSLVLAPSVLVLPGVRSSSCITYKQ